MPGNFSAVSAYCASASAALPDDSYAHASRSESHARPESEYALFAFSMTPELFPPDDAVSKPMRARGSSALARNLPWGNLSR